ncbi:hypothetical protein FQA39_LY12229 [Lamprigera yunnana]|nr:hypothetical protein FQA39_LY12229 [Lamprigera yunnana]
MFLGEFLIKCGYCFALFVFTFAVYVLLYEENRQDRYKSPDCYYVVKRVLAVPALKKLKKKLQKERLATNAELQEQPKKFTSETKANTQVVYGLDQNGNSLFLKLILKKHRLAEVTMYLNVDGKVYTFPNDEHVLFCSTQAQTWQVEGLTLTFLEPLKRFRITYNGLLKILENSPKVAEHVQFSFIWNCVDKPFDYPQDVPNELLCDALAKESWRNADWIHLLGDEKGFEQYGGLQGTVFGKAFGTKVPLSLQGFRKRYWGTEESVARHRDFSIFAVIEDGTSFNVGVKSCKSGCTRLKYGTFLDSLGNVQPINQHDINLEFVGEHKIPSTVTFHLKTTSTTYRCVTALMLKESFRAEGLEYRSWQLNVVPCKVLLNTEEGRGYVCLWYAKQGRDVDLPDVLLTESKIIPNPSRFAESYSKKVCESTLMAGEDGKNLALASSMNSTNFIVPKGFVVLTTAFKHYLENNIQLKKTVQNIKNLHTEDSLVDNIKSAADLCLSEPIIDDVEDSVLDELNEIGHGNIYQWRVRSSSILEEIGEENKIFLGLSENELMQAIASCWSSLFTYRNVMNRKKFGYDVATAIAVVVQRMLPSDVSGTLTTSNPSEIVIKSYYGLTADNDEQTDIIVLNRTSNKEFSLRSIEIRKKVTYVTYSRRRNVDKNKQNVLSLSDKQIKTLGRAAIELEDAFGTFCKIDWNFCGDILYVLQVKPITRINPWTEEELLTEFDTPVMSVKQVRTQANIGEIAPGALTTLTSSIMVDFLNKYFYKPYGTNWVGLYRYHLVLNVSKSIFYRRSTENVSFSAFDSLKFGMEAMMETYKTEQYLKDCREIVNREIEIGKNTVQETFTVIRMILSDLSTAGRCHARVTRNNIVQIVFLTNLVDTKWDSDYWSKLSLILPSSSNFEIIEQLKDALSKLIPEELQEDFINVKSSSAADWLKLQNTEIYQKLEQFAEKYRNRCVREFELSSRAWTPAEMSEELQFHCRSEKSVHSPNRINSAKSKNVIRNPVKRYILNVLIESCKKSILHREQAKLFVLKTVEKLRSTFKELSQRMMSEGFLTDADLIYHLSLYELSRLVENHDNTVLSRAFQRQELHQQWDKLPIPTFINSIHQTVGKKIKGTLINGEDVKGRACVVKQVTDLRQLLTGDVLISPSVNIHWAPYFKKVAGVVIETKGILSYGEIIAKDYELPCLVDAKDATLAFKTGDIVRISQKDSTVELLQ